MSPRPRMGSSGTRALATATSHRQKPNFPIDAAQPPEQAPQLPQQPFQMETTIRAEARQKVNRKQYPRTRRPWAQLEAVMEGSYDQSRFLPCVSALA